MRRVSIFIWFVMVCVLVVFGQQDAPPVRVAKISLPDPAYVGMPIWMQVISPTGNKILCKKPRDLFSSSNTS
jgi:hypothetical protein